MVTTEQGRLALRIDAYVKSIKAKGGGDEQIMTDMADVMVDFGVLTQGASRNQMDHLAREYSGFRDFAVLLTRLAAGIKRRSNPGPVIICQS